MRQALDLVAEVVDVELLDRLDDPSVEQAPPLMQEAAVRHLEGEGVLERVLELREETRLVDELRRLQPGEPGAQRILGEVGHRLQQREGDLSTDDGRRLQQALVGGGQAVDAGGQDRLHGGRHLDAGERLDETADPALADHRTRLHEGADALLEEERVALGASDEQCLRGSSSSHRRATRQELLSGFRWQRVQTHLGVVRLAAPAVLVLRAVVDEEEDARAWACSRPGCPGTPGSRCRSSAGSRR